MAILCVCGSYLRIIGEEREGQMRTGFTLICDSCGRRYRYLQGRLVEYNK